MANTKTTSDILVTTEWAEGNLDKDGFRFVEVDVDTSSYQEGHLPGAIGWNWKNELQDVLTRNVASVDAVEKLLGESGISKDTTIVLYGDNNNWFAAWAYWLLQYYGHHHLKILDGGRKKWVAEGGKLSTEEPKPKTEEYSIGEIREELRAFRDDVAQTISNDHAFGLVDVRSPDEFTGKIIAPPGMKELSQRGGHIPGAQNIPWASTVNEDGTFKSKDELTKIYADRGITSDKSIIAYCRIGERSAHSWFVLKELLNFENVRNYDGSWTEWGNLINAPIER
ncbi:MAG: sulfurtransferase [Balneolales bacterium]